MPKKAKVKFSERDEIIVSDPSKKRRLYEIEDIDEASRPRSNHNVSELEDIDPPSELSPKISFNTNIELISEVSNDEEALSNSKTPVKKLSQLVKHYKPVMGGSDFDSEDESDTSIEDNKLFGLITPDKLLHTRGYSYASFFVTGATPPPILAVATPWNDDESDDEPNEATELVVSESTKPDAAIQSLVDDCYTFIGSLMVNLEQHQRELRQKLADPSNTKLEQLTIAQAGAEWYIQYLSKKLEALNHLITNTVKPQFELQKHNPNNFAPCKAAYDSCMETKEHQMIALETYQAILNELKSSATVIGINMLLKQLSTQEVREEEASVLTHSTTIKCC